MKKSVLRILVLIVVVVFLGSSFSVLSGHLGQTQQKALVSNIQPFPPENSPSGTYISSVQITGSAGDYIVTVSGSGFGNLNVSLPYYGDLPYFRIGDSAQVGHGEWGYSGDANELNYVSWQNDQIVVSGFGGNPGDAIGIALWNPQTSAGATWGGNVPGGPSNEPVISSVQFSGSGENTSIVVSGNGFGNSPIAMPFTGDINYFGFGDFGNHSSAGSSKFSAGNSGWGVVGSDSVTLRYLSWSNTKIEISGFSGTYGQGSAVLSQGDPVLIVIWNSSDSSYTGPQTMWGGFANSTTSPPPSAPLINGVSKITTNIHQKIYINGTNFGVNPQLVPANNGYTGYDTVNSTTTPSIAILDNWTGGGGLGNAVCKWEAGLDSPGEALGYNAIGIFLQTWSSSAIVIDGFGSALGNISSPSVYNISVGDHITIVVQNPADVEAYYNLTVQGAPSEYPITFNEKGLPTGTSWSVMLQGETLSSTTSSIVFTEPNGTYSYTVSTANKTYSPLPASGSFIVDGSQIQVNIIFSIKNSSQILFSDDFGADSYINTTRWSMDSSILQNISSVESSVFGENIGMVTPPNFLYSFEKGLSLDPKGYLSMAGITSQFGYTPSFKASVTFAVLSNPGGNSMVIISNSTGGNDIAVFVGYQFYVQYGLNTPSPLGVDVQNGLQYDITINITSTSFTLYINSSSENYSHTFSYDMGGNQSLYLTLGSFVGTFPGETFSPSTTPDILFSDSYINSSTKWNLTASIETSSHTADQGVEVYLTNTITNQTETGITPSNGTIIFRNLISGEYEMIATQSQEGYVVSVYKYIYVGNPFDPQDKNLQIFAEITPPPIPPLNVAISPENDTIAMGPYSNTFVAVPSGYVGGYTYQWYVNGYPSGNSPSLYMNFNSPIGNSKSSKYTISLQVQSQGTWFGNKVPPAYANSSVNQIIIKEPIYLYLEELTNNQYSLITYNNFQNMVMGYFSGNSLQISANITDTYLANALPGWLLSIIGISYPFWGLNISDQNGNSYAHQVLQPGMAVSLNNFSMPGTFSSISELSGFAFDVTLNPTTFIAILGDVVQVALAMIGVISALAGIASNDKIMDSIIQDLVETLVSSGSMATFNLAFGSVNIQKIVQTLIDNPIGFLENLIPELPNITISAVEQYAPSYLTTVVGFLGSIGSYISKVVLPGWAILDLGIDIGAVLGAALKGDLSEKYIVQSYETSRVIQVNDPGAPIANVYVEQSGNVYGWQGKWEGNGYMHSSYTPSEYSFAVPANGTDYLIISPPNNVSSTNYNVSVLLGNKSYQLTGTTESGSPVEYILSGNSTSLEVTKTYSVTFTERGLPSGTSWSVTLNGVQGSSVSPAIIFYEPNGTYLYSINKEYGYSIFPQFGIVTVDGSNVSIPITFTHFIPHHYYKVSFFENGLPSNTEWGIAISGHTYLSNKSTIYVTLQNGLYNFTVITVPGFIASPSSGELRVFYGPVSLTITFTPVNSTVEFLETGLPSGTIWSVTLNGITKQSTNSTVVFDVPYGTKLNYTINLPSGYWTVSSPSPLTVKEHSLVLPVPVFHKVSNNSPYYFFILIFIFLIIGIGMLSVLIVSRLSSIHRRFNK
ncbi:MAG: hypothetical protein QXV17_11835 [Candidatus Micrarchaeaceae archaeon]